MTGQKTYKELAMLLGRTLGRANLYGIGHPAVSGAVEGLTGLMSRLIAEEDELTITSTDDKLLVNGSVVDGEEHLAGVIARVGLESITITRGVEKKDLAGLLRSLHPADNLSVEEALIDEGVNNIKVNRIHYVKTGQEGAAEQQDGPSGFTAGLHELSFESMLWKVIDRAVPGEDDKKKVFKIVMQKFQGEVSDKIGEATSELVKEKEAVIREKEQTESVISNSVQGSITVDGEGVVVMMNPEGEKVVGEPLRKVAGKPVWDGLKEGHMVTLAKGGEGAFTINDVIVKGEDETKRLIRSSNALIRNVEGRMVGIFSALSDVTKYKELEQMKRDFAANVTHELRTPIVATKQALANMLGIAAGLDPDMKRMIEISYRNTERLLRLVNDILDFSKLEAGKMKINQEIVETGPFLDEVTTSLAPFAGSKGVGLEFREHGALPRLFVDRDRTVQVLTNLLGNAIKFTDPGGSVTVEVLGMQRHGSNTLLRISVADTGRGIPGKDLEKIFEKFVQVGGKDTTAMKGTGLGLSITRAIVELHGGSIEVQSEPGAGSVFTIALPMLPEDSLYLEAKGMHSRPAAGEAQLKC